MIIFILHPSSFILPGVRLGTLQETRFMLSAGLLLAPFRRFASLCAAAAVLLPIGCQINLPMKQLLVNGPPVPGPLSSGLTPPLRLTVAQGSEEAETGEQEPRSSGVIRTSNEANAEDPSTAQMLPTAADALPAPLADAEIAAKGVVINLDLVLRMTYERHGEILLARERVKESQIALDAALRSCMPEALRKDNFKKPVAEALLWRRRAELRKVENDKLLDAANTYFDWLTVVRGERVARDLMKYEEKLLERARKLAELEKPTQVLVTATEAALNGRQQFVARTRQQTEAATIKLAYLMGLNGEKPAANETLEPIDRVDTSLAVEVLVRQAQDNGPGVPELQGLIASIQQGIEQARGAQC
ncbi:MAG: TolC family protein, partial [Gemmataceae bacterium]